MKTFVINLKRSQERRKHIEGQLSTLGIQFEIIDAVDGSELSEETINNFKNIRKAAYPKKDRRAWDVSDGVIGCALSHLKAYQEIINRDIEISIILEDDAALSKGLLKLYDPLLINRIKNIHNLDILQLAAVKQHFAYLPQLKYRGRQKIAEGMTIGMPAKTVPGTCCYLITLEGAKKLLQASQPLRYSSDQLLANSEYFDSGLWVAKQPLCFQNRELSSTIENRIHDHRKVSKRLKGLWGKLQHRLSIKRQLAKLGWIPYIDQSILKIGRAHV